MCRLISYLKLYFIIFVGFLQMFLFNGRIDGDVKKCWLLDVVVFEDGIFVIIDFYNKKIKVFDVIGIVMGEVNLYILYVKFFICINLFIFCLYLNVRNVIFEICVYYIN